MAKVFDIKDNHKVAYKQGAVLGHKKNSEGVYGAVEGTFTRDGGATRIGKTGLIESVADGVPQVDFEGGNSAYVLEPTRMNKIFYSEDFSHAGWSKSDITVENNYTAPDGSSTSNKITPNSNNARHGVYVTGKSIIGHTYSVFAKADGYDWILLSSHISSIPVTRGTFFNVKDGYIGNVGTASQNAKIEDIGNGWYRCSIDEGSSPSSLFSVVVAEEDNIDSFSGDGSKGVLVWGAQLEEDYTTSYIPTNGTTVTRNESTLTDFGNEYLFNSSEGVLFVEMAALADTTTSRPITLSNGSSDSDRVIIAYQSSSGAIFTAIVVSGSLVYSHSESISVLDFNKVALSYQNNRFTTFINGVKVNEQLSGSSFSSGTLKDLKFNRPTISSEAFYGKVKQLQVYDTALTDAELIVLTS